MIRAITLSLVFSFMQTLYVLAVTYPNVLFENSVLKGNYMYSDVQHDQLSWVENVGGRLPVSDSVFFTPGNSLSLKYSGGAGGNWKINLAYPGANISYRPDSNDVLTLKIFVASDSEAETLPTIAIRQKDTITHHVDLSNYVSEFRTNMWLNVRIPLTAFGGYQMQEGVKGVQFAQGGASNGTNLIYVDQVEFLPTNPPKAKLSSPAVLSTAVAYDRHIDLTWQLPLTPSIRYIKIYRSEDKEHFAPVAIRPVFAQKCTDFVPYSNKTYYYKIAWVDYDYLESPFSNIVEASTHTASDSLFLNFIQGAHFNYFAERAEVNSGMHAVHFGVDDATVSVKETGLSILSLVVGAERGFISNVAAVGRVERILEFLSKVDRYNGAFPALIDGRTGKGVFANDTVPEADLRATAFLMQGLIVAEQYFKADTDSIGKLTEKTNALWNSIAWDRFVIEGQESILLDRWSPITEFQGARPLGGFGEDLICYVLALASPLHALEPNAYKEGLGIPRQLADSAFTLELANNSSFSVTLPEKNDFVSLNYKEYPYTNDTTAYGMHYVVGSLDTTLLEAYVPFFALDPRNKRDVHADYFTNNVNLTKAYRRRDNEKGYGGFSRDIWGLDRSADTTYSKNAINPALPSASFAYLPAEATQSMRELYTEFGQALFTEYGFRKWIDLGHNSLGDGFDAVSQAAVVVMIENGRTGLIWNLFSGHPDIKKVIENHFIVE